jgi:hypothetical protein
MILTRNQHALEIDLLKWTLLCAAAIIIAMALATVLGAANPMLDPMAEPARLPADAALLAKPMDAVPDKPYFPELGPANEIQLPPAALAAKVWMILEQQRAGLDREALAGWREIELAGQADVWRQIAMAAAHLGVGKLERAATNLDQARTFEQGQALVAYYTGILRMEQARMGIYLPDELNDAKLRLVAYDPLHGPVGQTVMRVLARRQLQLAIAQAGEIRLDERLVTGEANFEEAVIVPRVGDLLVALGADNFVGKAHHLLFGLEMDRGELRQAEEHLDLAVAAGVAPLFGYEDLAAAYTVEEQPADALRAMRKDFAANYPLLWEAGQEMKATMKEVWEGWTW